MKHRNKSFHDYRGFSGSDINIEINLREYGLIWKKVKKNKYVFVYGIDVKENNYNRFTYAFMSKRDWIELCDESWFNIDKICEYCGSNKNTFKISFPYNIHDAIVYHGAENIFGTNYNEGYTIGGEV